jgi:hypothetical protein
VIAATSVVRPAAHQLLGLLPLLSRSPLSFIERLADDYGDCVQLHLVLTTIAKRYRMRLVQDEPIQPLGLLTLRPKSGIPVRLEKRG